jgi:translocation and assembly module TamB
MREDDLREIRDDEPVTVHVRQRAKPKLWWGEWAGGALIAVMIVIVLGATVLWIYSGTDWGHERMRVYAQNFLQKQAKGGRVHIGGITGNLLTGVEVHDFVITDTAGKPFIAVPRMTGTYGIGDLLQKRVWINNVVLERPLIVLDRGPISTWNWKRIFPRDTTPKPASRQNGWMDRLQFFEARVIDGTLVVRTPWRPSKRLNKAAADSAVRAALSGDSRLVVERVPGGYQKILRLQKVTAYLPVLRLSEPGYTYRLANIASLSMEAFPFRPPGAEVRAFTGLLPFNDDSVWWHDVRARLPDTYVRGDGTFGLSSGDLTMRAHATSTDFADMRWVYPRLPSDAKGTLDFDLKWREGMEQYIASNANVTVGPAHILGSLGVTFTDTVEIHHTNLRFTQVSTTLLEQVIGGFKSPRRGMLSGTAQVHGGRNALVVNGDVAFSDLRAGTSRVIARGEIGFPGKGVRARDLHLAMRPFQVELVRQWAPTMPISGVVSGTATLNGSTNGEMRIVADIDHMDRGNRSILNGRATVSLAGGKRFDVEAVARPVSLAEVGLFFPAAELRGGASGPFSARGTLDDLKVAANMGVSGNGHLDVRAALDLNGTKRYDVKADLHTLNLAAVTGRAPATSLTLKGSVVGVGTNPETMRATIVADAATSRWDSVLVDTASVRATISGGLAQVPHLFVAGSHARAVAQGSFGLAASRSGTLAYAVDVDSLAAFNRWVPGLGAGTDTAVVVPRPALVARAYQVARTDSAKRARDTEIERIVTGKAPPKLNVKMPRSVQRNAVGGVVHAAGTISGNLKDFDLLGTARGADVSIRGNYINRFASEYAWTDARTSHSKLALGVDADSVMAMGFALDSVQARVSYANRSGHADLLVRQDQRRDYVANADYSLSPKGNEVRLATLRVRLDTALWVAPHPSTINWGGPGIRVTNFEVRNRGNGRVYANGLLPTEGVADFQLAIDDFPTADIVDLLQSDLDLRGMVDLSGSMSGTLRNPAFRGAFAVTQGEYQGTTLPDLRGRFGYSDRELVTHVDALRSGGTAMAAIDGRIPVNLALSGVTGSRLIDAPMQVDVAGDSLPIELIPHFTDAVSDMRGQVAGRFAMRGRLQRPSLTGAVTIRNTSITVNASGTHVENMNGVVTMANDVVTIGRENEPITGVAGNGPIALRGTLNVGDSRDPSMDLYLYGEHAEVLDNKWGKLKADVGLALKGPFKSPYLSGQVTVTSGVIYAPEPTGKHIIGAGDPQLFYVLDTALVSDRELFPAESPLLRNMRMEVTVEINRDTWVRNREANVEIYTDYPLRVNVSQEQLNLTGVVATDRGDYTFLSKRFQISRGSAMFIGSREINPTLQITGEYSVTEGGGQNLDVKVVIGGTLKRPKLSLESDAQPPRSQSELISLLAFGQPTTSLGSINASSLSGGNGSTLTAGAQLATRQLAGVALGVGVDQLEASFGKALATDYFNITPADVPLELVNGSGSGVSNFLQSTRFEGGKYLNPRTFIVGQMVGLGVPGATIQYRASEGWRYEASAASRFILKQPTLSDQAYLKKQAFGAFIIRQWKF